jgi:putative ABC transport system permease protein
VIVRIASELRQTVRRLRGARGFTIGVIAVLALGIGANAAVFSALDQTVIQPLPYPESSRLAMVWEDLSAYGMPKDRVAPGTYHEWQRRTRTFASLAALRLSEMDVGSSAPEQVSGAAVTANLFPTLGVEPQLGRNMTVDEDPPGHRVVLLSYGLWQRRFAGALDIVGRTMLMSGEPYVVIGVMPRGFHFPDARTEYWIPISLAPGQFDARNSHYLQVVGRIRAGVRWPAVRDDMDRIARELATEFPASNAKVGVTVVPLQEEVTSDAAHALTLLLAAACCVLLIACANIASLLIARVSGRRREIAVRLALGAGRGGIVRQMLMECGVLAAAGGGAGLVAAYWGVRALEPFVPPALAASTRLHLDVRAAVFTLAVTGLTTLLCGVAPAAHAARADLSEHLKAQARTAHRRTARLRRVLVVGEIAVALVLVAAAALLIDTLAHLRAVDPGFRADHLLTARIDVPYPKYADAARRQAFYAGVLAGVRALPGVERAGLTSDLPYTSTGDYMGLTIENRPSSGVGRTALFRLVSPGYLQTIGASVSAGRPLDAGDTARSAPVAVVSDVLARTYWPHQSALGHRIDTGTGDGAPRWMTIVGVVRDVRERGADLGSKPTVYVPFTQTAIAFFQPSEIAVRTSVPPEALAGPLRQAVWAVDPAQPVSDVRTMDEIVDEALGYRRRVLSLLGVFAALAIVLAGLGVYSLLSWIVSDQRREIGLRIALGATPGTVTRTVFRQSAILAGVGVALGLACADVATPWLGALLFDVSPVDPPVLASSCVILIAVALAASLIPARRAAALDPMIVLREE